MKQMAIVLLCLVRVTMGVAQPMPDTTGKLVEQKENIITESTIIKVENLGQRINTEYPELRPTISADGNLLFFIRMGHPANEHIATVPNAQDIWYSIREEDGNWSPAEHLNGAVNASQYNAVFWISPDLNTMLIKGAYVDGQYLGMGVSITRLQKNGDWSPPQMLRIRNLHKFSFTQQFGASMGQDGKTLLLYMSDKKNSFDNDIYVSFLEGNDIWTAPKSLGKKINLEGYNDMSPFIAADGTTLYFSSDRPGGLGMNDIWMSKRLDDKWNKWSEPVNLGAPINTSNDEAFFTLDAGGEYAYLTSSDGAFGASDIVRVKLMEREKPDPVLMVTGNVYNEKTRQPMGADLLYEILPDGTEVGRGSSNPVDGSFKIVLPFDKNYLIRASADKFFAISENLNLDSLFKRGYKVVHKDLYLAPIEVGQVFRLNNVFFDFDKYDLRPESATELNRVILFLNDYPNVSIELGAHTDSKGSDEYNLTLSHNRAKSCMEYILKIGKIDPARVSFKGYGETVPIAPNAHADGSDNPEGRQLNRRVEFKIMKN